MPEITLHAGDCRDVLFDLAVEGQLFDAVVCDPPYDLTSVVKRFGGANAAPAQFGRDGAFQRQSRGFMGKTWDGTGVAFDPATWRAVFDVMKPGAYLLAFGGTRTFHRMACAIEDAGFEIRDTLCWIYGTGFPKSHDVSKAIDQMAGIEREQVPPRSVIGHQRDIGNRRPYMDDPNHTTASDIPATPEAAQWQGWGTALKPAYEPIIVARKPLDCKTVAANVLTHGTGALNVDACRIPLAADDKLQDGLSGRPARRLDTPHVDSKWGFECHDRAAGLGRFPANVLHDGSDEVEEAFARFGESKSGVQRKPIGTGGIWSPSSGTPAGPQHGDSGTASRFFYSAKAGKNDRAGSKHPTVKPLALMRWLCTLVTQPGGTVLDPFAGSGTTLQAAHECGFSAVGIEREPEYLVDIEARIAATLADLESLL